MMPNRIFFIFFIGLSSFFFYIKGKPDGRCLQCICKAVTGCDMNYGCYSPDYGRYLCGPFRISWPYWADAGKPVIEEDNPDDDDAYPRCTKNVYCAMTTVRQYMEKFNRDCNGDGTINCDDFGRMHMMGGYACNDTKLETNDYYQRFASCLNESINDEGV